VETTWESQRGQRMPATSASTFCLSFLVFPGQAGLLGLGELAASLAKVWSKPWDCFSCRTSEWVTTMRRSAPQTFWRVLPAASRSGTA